MFNKMVTPTGGSGGSIPQGALNMIPYDSSWTCTDDGHLSNDYIFESSMKNVGNELYDRGWLPNSASQKCGTVEFNQSLDIKYMSYGRACNGTMSAFTDYIDKIQYSTDGTNFVDLPNSETTLSSTKTIGAQFIFFSINETVRAIKLFVRAQSTSGQGIKIAFWN